MCGEHGQLGDGPAVADGSSPHVRGTRAGRPGGSGSPRFIPACAGNTTPGTVAKLALTVHPRMCGEHHGPQGTGKNMFGSSPHVRGTRDLVEAAFLRRRFIPACAGNTARPPSWKVSGSVHPRMCGEHALPLLAGRADFGSSPHVRGTLSAGGRHGSGERFIPACAGNTKMPRIASGRVPVHPRMCGEHMPTRVRVASPVGSSPHVRGTRH